MKKIDVAIIGLGSMGGTHALAAGASPYIRKIYGYEPDADFRVKHSAELGIIDAELKEILRNPAIKLVCIASVNEVHAEQTIMALRAGKAVLCEKPMGITLEEARSMVEAEKESGSFLQIGFELHYSKLFMTAKEWIDRGLIGRVVNCHCRYYCCEFHKKNSWRSKSKGTLIGEKLSHYLDLQRWWINDQVEKVYSFHAPNVVKYFNHPDNHQINIQFRKGAVACLNFVMNIAETNHSDPLREMLEKQSDDGHYLQFHIIGEKGAIETDVFRRRIRRWEFTDSPTQLVSRIVDEHIFPPQEDRIWFHNVHGQILRVAQLVATGADPDVSASDAYETMKLCFAAERSEKEERIIEMSELADL